MVGVGQRPQTNGFVVFLAQYFGRRRMARFLQGILFWSCCNVFRQTDMCVCHIRPSTGMFSMYHCVCMCLCMCVRERDWVCSGGEAGGGGREGVKGRRGVACTSGEGEASVKTHDPSWHVSGSVPHVLNSYTFPSLSVFSPTTLTATRKLSLRTTATPVAINSRTGLIFSGCAPLKAGLARNSL